MTRQDPGPRVRLEQLQESEARYRQLFEVHPHPMWVYDDETLRFLAVNDAAIARYGYSREEFLALRITDIRPVEDVPRLVDTIRTLSPGMRTSGTWRHRTKTGELLSVEISTHSVEFSGRKASLVQALDVTARLAAEAALAVERDRLEAAQRVAKVGNWETDLLTFDVIWSAETFRIFGLDPATYRPTHGTFLQLVHPADREVVDAAFRASFETRDICTVTHRLLLGDGTEKHVEERWRTLVDAAGAPIRAAGTCQDITNRVEAAAALEQGISLLRVASAMSRLGAFSVDLLTGLRFWSEELSAIFDLEPGQTPPLQEALAFYQPADRVRMRRAYDACATDGIAYDEELEAATRTGRRIWVRTIGEAVRNNQGAIVGIRGATQDITDRRLAAEALRRSEERLRLLADATNDAIYDWDLTTDALTWNEGFWTMFGYARGEVEPTLEALNRLIHPEDEARTTREMRQALAGKDRTWAGEYRMKRRDGTYAFVVDRGHILRDEAGQATWVIGGITDLTARKETEERLEQQAALLDAAHDAILVKDLADRITYWNKGAERNYGWMAHEAIGRRAAELFHLDPVRYREATEAVFARGQWEGELVKQGRDGEDRTVSVHWTLVRDRQGAPRAIFAIDTDVTERKQLEMQFLRAQRLESLGTLAGGIAHDLNNVLAPILVSIELLRMDDLDPERLESLATIETSAKRGAAMVQQVLTFARGVEGKRLPIDVTRVAREAQKIARDTFPKRITIQLTAAPDLWTVHADATQIHQVLTNLSVNARDAMPKGGALTITLANVKVDDAFVRMHTDARSGGYVTLTVSDTGTGIPLAVQERLFEPFFTTKEIGKGTGLGLSTVHSIVRSHGGFIDLQSEPGRGTRFTIYLPALIDVAAAPDATEGEAPLPRGRGELILVVDDEASIRSIVQRTLERFGYRVLQAANGAEGIARLQEHGGSIDLVLTDMAMPVMDGPTMIAAMRAIDPGLRIVASSGLTSGGSIADALAAGVTDFVSKPYTAETLLATLHRVLREPAAGR